MLAGLVGDRAVLQSAEVDQRALNLGGDAAAGLTQLGAQCAGAAEDAVGREVLQQDVVVAETIDQRAQNGVRTDAGHGALDGALQLGGLGNKDHDIHDADVVGGIGGLEPVQMVMGVGVNNELQTVFRDLVHVSLITVHQCDVRAALAQVSGEAASGRTAADHGDFHFQNSSIVFGSVTPCLRQGVAIILFCFSPLLVGSLEFFLFFPASDGKSNLSSCFSGRTRLRHRTW